jgi:hypothetical protein
MNLLNNILILILILILINYLTNGKLFVHVKQSFHNIKMKCLNWMDYNEVLDSKTKPVPPQSNNLILQQTTLPIQTELKPIKPINPETDVFLISDNKEKLTNDDDSLIPSSIEFSTA